MVDSVLNTLFLPFEEKMLPLPGPARGFFLRAQNCSALQGEWRERLICEQTLKPEVDRLKASGCTVVPRLTGEFDLGLSLLTKHKSENLVNLGRAWNLLAPGGVLLCAGAKNLGAVSIETQMRAAFGLEGKLSKAHARLFWSRKPLSGAPSPPKAWFEMEGLKPNVEGTYLTCPGIFSWQKIDAGSRLLLENLPETIAGSVADLGAGWGYLSFHLLQRFAGIRSLDLFEIEGLALEAARANLAGAERARFYWHDVTAGLTVDRPYDWVVMNPPFHEGRAANADLGGAFIEAARQALCPGGNLLMVANRHLPYEHALRRAFTTTQLVAESAAFKVLAAQK